MALKTSTGLRNYVLDTGPVITALDLGFIKIYSGIPPLTADAALGSAGANTLLATISNNDTGTGLTFEAVALDGTLEKKSTETWSSTAVGTGTASFYRHVSASDTGADSSTEPRYQGTVSTIGADLNMSEPAIVALSLQTIDYYLINLPTL